ncbi:fimbrial biogenesis chaperone [Pseudomonas sp. AU10]|nr:molecular chaperone [Pseudomonas sp. AU10]
MSLFKHVLLAGLLTALTPYAQAGVVVGATRVIYESNKKEVSLSIKNPEEKAAYLIQTWVDNESPVNTAKTPFIVTPPLFRLDAGQENLQRIVYVGSNLPPDRESAFWLNVKSIPAVERVETNRLLISVNTRIKLLYRPKGLGDFSGEAYKQLKFVQQGNSLRITNPTPYYVSFRQLMVGGKKVNEPGMVPPKGELTHSLPAGVVGKITWSAINDYGGTTEEAVQ